jgi:hypothetical protein
MVGNKIQNKIKKMEKSYDLHRLCQLLALMATFNTGMRFVRSFILCLCTY